LRKRFISVLAFSALAAAFIVLGSGCAQLMGSLRRDLDDQAPFADEGPTLGGRGAGTGFLNDDLPEGGSVGDRYVGHSERNPASETAGGRAASSSWISPDRADANRRDAFRGAGDSDEELSSATQANVEPNVRRQYKNGSRATRADFLDESQNEGSLWASDGQTNYYFTKNKVRGVGDIISLVSEEGLVRDVASESRRSLSPRERDFELAAAQERLRLKATGGAGDGKDSVASSAAAPSRAPAADGKTDPNAKPEVEVPVAGYADVDMTKTLEFKAGDVMMGEIIERYPNGNYKIRATKKIPYKGGAPRTVTLVGVVKGSDIGDDDSVASGKLYEYRVDTNR
jgi:flagellar basal body L-ring protein FlgH